jgi:mRNA interferase RelE/StbE
MRSLPKRDLRRVDARIQTLAVDPLPRGSLKLEGAMANWYRLRVGVYRILYETQDDAILVLVLRVRHRREAYR